MLSNNDLAGETGPLWGRGRSATEGQIADIENDILDDWKDWCYALEHAGLKQQRRELIMRVDNLTAEWIDADKLRLEFSLSSGCYATTLMREIAELSRPMNFAL
jgi:tRNA pseudouridine13 synthase